MTASLEQEIQTLREIQGSEHDPEGRVFVHLADARRRNGELDEALELLEEGLERHPEFSSAHVVAGWVHRDRGEKHEAGSAFRRVLELDEENTAALRGLGELAEARGGLNAALGWFRRLVALVPEDEEIAGRIRTLEEQLGLDAGGELESAEAFSELDEIMVGEAPTDEERDEFARMDSVGDASDLGDILTMGEPLDEGEEVAAAEEGAAELSGPDEAEDEGHVADEAEAEGEEWEPEDGGDEEVRTKTMGELYARQGLFEKAVEVFEHLAEERPDDERLRVRLTELREKAEEGAPAVGAAATAEESVETLAREMSSGEGATGDLDTPFAWEEDPRDEGFAGGEEEAGEPISTYLGRLLTWEPGDTAELPGSAPGAVPVESLAPDTEAAAEAVPIESLAPDAPTPDAAPDATPVPIESLAPDAGAAASAPEEERPALPLDDDEGPEPMVVMAESSGEAPGEVPGEDVVPIESLAPDQSPPADDDFDRWLDRLK